MNIGTKYMVVQNVHWNKMYSGTKCMAVRNVHWYEMYSGTKCKHLPLRGQTRQGKHDNQFLNVSFNASPEAIESYLNDGALETALSFHII